VTSLHAVYFLRLHKAISNHKTQYLIEQQAVELSQNLSRCSAVHALRVEYSILARAQYTSSLSHARGMLVPRLETCNNRQAPSYHGPVRNATVACASTFINYVSSDGSRSVAMELSKTVTYRHSSKREFTQSLAAAFSLRSVCGASNASVSSNFRFAKCIQLKKPGRSAKN
jgi:hypothetical protein